MQGLRNNIAMVGLGTSRWLEAIWEPNIRLTTLPNGLDMLDSTGDGDARLIAIDLGTIGVDSAKVRIYKSNDQITEHSILDSPCGVVGFYTENKEPGSTVLAVAAGASVYIYKNMRPYFKYCLPQLDAHPKEREIWHKAGLEGEINVLSLSDDLELLLKELGAAFISPRTLKYLSLDINLRNSFAEQYRMISLIKSTTLTAIDAVRKDSWHDPAASCLILGTENGDLLVLDSRTFSVMDKYQLGWPPVAFATSGLWTGDGRIMMISRDGKIGSIRKGSVVKLWEKLSAPAVAISTLTGDGAAVAVMDGRLIGYSKKGTKLWNINVPGLILDMTSLPVPHNGLSLLAVSTAGFGVRIYDEQYHVDTIKTSEPVSAIKYGRMGQEERAMAMVTVNGGLCVKILKRTADFSIRNSETTDSRTGGSSKFIIPKKTRLFVEQTIRERSEAKEIHKTFQQGVLRLRLEVAKKAYEQQSGIHDINTNPVTLETSVLGLGPNYSIHIIITNISDDLSDTELFLVCRDDNNANLNPRVINVPLLPSAVPIPVTIRATLRNPRISSRIQVLLCKNNRTKPVIVTNATLPAAEEEIDI